MIKGEGAFSAALGVGVLLLVPAWGGTGTLLGLGAGSVVYALVFRKRLRDRGWLGAIISLVAAALVAAAVVVVLSIRQAIGFETRAQDVAGSLDPWGSFCPVLAETNARQRGGIRALFMNDQHQQEAV
jgi:hypothetical protein